jgi:hypothetical protein
MLDFLNYLALFILLLKILSALSVFAAVMFCLRLTAGPLFKIGQWMMGSTPTPGTPPDDIAAGIAHGGRILAWAAVLGLALWFLFI